ncbi:hypothetical protein F5X99DRAFT_409075 [Biscogniauxia marginata]|nr:hypothetical protein F5X99DRAFT_409075 [Biscogniauxia marginata]
MSYSYWSKSSVAGSLSSSRNSPPSSAALNYFSVVTTAEIPNIQSGALNLFRSDARLAGTGGFSTIEVGRHKRHGLVAVKRSRFLPQVGYSTAGNAEAFGSHFAQFTQELQILSHSRIRSHPNIVHLLGICSSVDDKISYLALVLEYSSIGTLKSYLSREENHNPPAECVALILQIAQGVAVLHELQVAHCDLKTDNVLLFLDKGDLKAKLSDFGQALLVPHGDSDAHVEPRNGTPLLNAPEIRNGRAFEDENFNISVAMLCDVFSFGLLVWEVMKGGSSFFDVSWVSSLPCDIDIEQKEEALNNFPNNGLLDHSLSFISTIALDPMLKARLRSTLRGCLQDDPHSRKSIFDVVKILTGDSSHVPRSACLNTSSTSSDSIATWTTQDSLYTLRMSAMKQGYLVDLAPYGIQERAYSELESIAWNEIMTKDTRGHAAMLASECYTIGFGVPHNSREAVHWLHYAASLGYPKAVLWYPRVCNALGITPDLESIRREEKLSSLPVERYLCNRIWELNASLQDWIREQYELGAVKGSTAYLPGHKCHIGIFNSNEVDVIDAVHIAAWLGDVEALLMFLNDGDARSVSPLGFDVAHFACLGGHISVLNAVANSGLSISQKSKHGITPLHLAIFFPPKFLKDALNLLSSNGSSVEASTKEVDWHAHDIGLSGTPLEWATACRYHPLVQYLAPISSPETIARSHHIATTRFFPDLVEILSIYQCGPLHDPFDNFLRPFSHWIAHGSEHTTAIERTVSALDDETVASIKSELRSLVGPGATDDMLHLIQIILSRSSLEDLNMSNYVEEDGDGYPDPVIFMVIELCSHKPSWLEILEMMLKFYSSIELDRIETKGDNCLTYAVRKGSIPAVKTLLEKGMDVNHTPNISVYSGSAIHAWQESNSSQEMLEILVKFGADVSQRHPVYGHTIIEVLVHEPWRIDQLKLVLKISVPNDETSTSSSEYEGYSEVLHHVVDTLLVTCAENGTLGSRIPSFEALLSYPGASHWINAPNDDGHTLLQKAVQWVNLDIISLLLDAGADASIPFFSKLYHVKVYPLQVVCIRLWLLHHPRIQEQLKCANPSRLPRKMRENGWAIVTELLQWHIANGDGLFQDVTELHLKYATGELADAEDLIRRGDFDSETPCCWPDSQTVHLPRDLQERENRLSEINVVADFEVPKITFLGQQTAGALMAANVSQPSLTYRI